MHHTTDTIKAITFDQTPSTEAADANNNNSKKGEKYSLRQRQSRRTQSTNSSVKSDKKSKEKPKPKAAPLSKYRRKTANARERTRMREINTAFESLRRAVPIAVAGPSVAAPIASPQTTANEKLTKITTLRLAMKYIRILSDILNNSDSNLMFNNNDMDAINNNDVTAEIMSKGLLLNESIFKPILKQQMQNIKTSNSKSNKLAKNIQSRRNASTKLNFKLNNKTDLGPCLTSPMNQISTAAALGLILESDGESLQLSEPCLSPLDHHMSNAFNCSSSSNDNLELGLLLESDGDSLQLSEPCLSPLSHLDSLNPFNDLLHTGFNEQTALELYL